jgi:hypothetical protein
VESQAKAGLSNYRGGSIWNAGWCAYVSFFRDQMQWEDSLLENFTIDEDLAKSCGWVWWHENVLAISDRPEILNRDDEGRLHCENGPSIAYRDGWSLYHFHGVTVPQLVIESPDQITIQMIESESNAEVRRVMMERYGYDRYILDCDSELVDSCRLDHPIIGLRDAKLRVKKVSDDEPIVYIDLLNSTPEPDGSVKRYLMRVDPNAYGGDASMVCQAAAASTWRESIDGELVYKDWRDYAPVFES